jgi:hypothetical protein
MRRKWPVLAAAIPLIIGWALVAAHPGGAHPPALGGGGGGARGARQPPGQSIHGGKTQQDANHRDQQQLGRIRGYRRQ